MREIIEDIFEASIEFVRGNWKPVLIFFLLIITGIAIILYQTIDNLKETEKIIKEDSTKGIVNTFVDTGKETSENLDPATKGVYLFLWWFLGVIFVLIIVLAIANAFKPLIESLNPWNIAKNIRL